MSNDGTRSAVPASLMNVHRIDRASQAMDQVISFDPVRTGVRATDEPRRIPGFGGYEGIRAANEIIPDATGIPRTPHP